MDTKALKDKILQLAMQGKLVPQDENDEPASVLLERIKKEKEPLIKNKKIKKEKALPEITEDEIPYELPKGWEWVRLGAISFKITDGSHNPPKGEENRTKYLMLSSQNISSKGLINLGKSRFLSKENYDIENKRTNLSKGDLLLTIVGSIGKSYIYNDNYNIVLQRSVGVINTKYCNKYIKYFFDSPITQNYFKANSSGTAQKGIYLNQLKSTIIALPPLNEQKRIVKKIDSLFNLVDELENNKQDLLQNISDVRNKALQLAIQGKLVPQDENDEPASLLLEKIKKEKEQLIKDKKIKKEKALPEITEDEIPYELPKGWEWVRLGEYTQINPRNNIDDNIDVSFIPMAFINEGFGSNYSYKIKKWCEIKKGFTHFAENDVIIAKITPCFQNRKSAVMKNLVNRYGAGTTELYVIRTFNGLIIPEYLLINFKTNDFINGGLKTIVGTAGQQRIKKDYISNLLIPIPPLNEQKRIVEKLDSIMKLCDELESELNN